MNNQDIAAKMVYEKYKEKYTEDINYETLKVYIWRLLYEENSFLFNGCYAEV